MTAVGGLLVLAATTHASHARADTLAVWTEATLSAEVTQRVDLGVTQHFRVGGEGRRYMIGTEPFVEWQPLKPLSLGAGYRIAGELPDTPGTRTWDLSHQPFAEAAVQHDIGHLRGEVRLRFEDEFGWPASEGGVFEHKPVLRERLKLRYAFTKKVFVAGSGELFTGRPLPGAGYYLEQWRAGVDLGWRPKPHGLDLFYRYIDDLHPADKPHTHVIGLAYELSL